LHAWTGRSVSLASGDRPEQVQAAAVTPGWITNFGLTLQAGRDFTPEEGQVVQSLDPDLPMAGVRTMEQVVEESLQNDRFNALLFGSFGVLALLLAASGIYGVMSFVVAQRTHEVGLRIALGASKGQVLLLVMRKGMNTALLGTAIGFVGAYFVGRAMQGMWFGVAPLDLVRFAAVALVLVAAALLACYVPARRAATIEPLTALREQ
jgi:ABC-type antimicrobial peptide transport system permease subunit